VPQGENRERSSLFYWNSIIQFFPFVKSFFIFLTFSSRKLRQKKLLQFFQKILCRSAVFQYYKPNVRRVIQHFTILTFWCFYENSKTPLKISNRFFPSSVSHIRAAFPVINDPSFKDAAHKRESFKVKINHRIGKAKSFRYGSPDISVDDPTGFFDFPQMRLIKFLF